jgi:hypothetical protein
MQEEFLFTPEELSPIAKRFAKYHAENPDVYEALVDLARKCRKNRPDRVIGIQMLFEVLRWNYFISINSEEEYKFPNAFAAGYARLIMEKNPDLAGIFKTNKSLFDL